MDVDPITGLPYVTKPNMESVINPPLAVILTFTLALTKRPLTLMAIITQRSKREDFVSPILCKYCTTLFVGRSAYLHPSHVPDHASWYLHPSHVPDHASWSNNFNFLTMHPTRTMHSTIGLMIVRDRRLRCTCDDYQSSILVLSNLLHRWYSCRCLPPSCLLITATAKSNTKNTQQQHQFCYSNAIQDACTDFTQKQNVAMQN